MKEVRRFFLILIFLVSISFSNVKAESLVNKKNYDSKKGETVTVLVDLDSKNNNAYNYEGIISYDSNVLELLTKSSFENDNGGANSLTNITYDNKTNKFVLITSDDSVTKDVVEIKFKIKEDVSVEKTTVNIRNIKSINGTNEYKLDDIKFDITITDVDLSSGNTLLIAFLICLAVIFIVSAIIYNNKVNDNKNSLNKKKVLTILGAFAFLSVASAIVLVLINNKEYEETKTVYELELKNIADLEPIPGTGDDNKENNPNGNNTQNNNEKEPSTDTPVFGENGNNGNSSNIELTAKIISSYVSNYYPEKGEIVDIFLKIQTNSKENVKSVIINGEEYPVVKEKDDRYKLRYTASNNSGLEDIKISEIKFSEKSITTTYELKIDILKDKPTVEDFTLIESGEKPIINFNVKGNNSFIEGTIIVTDSKENVILSESIKEGNNAFILNIKENGKYNVSIETNYDLDTNELNYFTGDKNTGKETSLNKTLDLIVDYELKINDVKITKIDSNTNTVTIEFTSSNISNHDVSKVIIDGQEYTVRKNKDGSYSVDIVLENNDRTKLKITEVVLDNDKKLDVTTEELVVFKKTPASSVNVEIKDNNKVNVTYKITDEDNIADDIKIVLRNKDGKIVETKTVSKLSDTVSFDVENAGDYTVEVLATYDSVDGLEHKDEIIGKSKELTIKIEAEITNSKVSSEYVEKNGKVEIFYTIEDNTAEEITALVINGVEYKVEKQNNGSYKIVYTVKDKYGTENIKVSSIKYNSDTVNVENNTSVYVLKSALTITDFDFDGSTDEKENITFNIKDSDDTFVDGTITITGNGVNKTIKIVKGTDKYELGLEDNGLYNVTITVNYDRDNNKTDGLNKGTVTLKQEIQVITNYGFTFANPTIKSVDYDNKQVTIEFTSTNYSKYGVISVVINGVKYEVTRNGDTDTYTVVVTLDNTNKQNLVFEKAILEDHKEFPASGDVVVFKNAPTAQVELVVTDNKTINAIYVVLDNESIAKDIKIILKDKNGNIIETKSVTELIGSVSFDTTQVGKYYAGTYTVEVVATYDAVDGRNHKNEVLANNKAKIKIEAEIIKSFVTVNGVTSKYVAKNGIADIYYTIDSNTTNKVVSMTINGTKYTATYQTTGTYAGTYKVSYVAGTTVGEETIKITSLDYQNEEVEVEYNDTIQILKDKPGVNNFKYDEDKQTISFTLSDNDESFISGEVVVATSNGTKKFQLEKGKTNYEFNLEITNNTVASINVNVTFDLDNDSNNDLNSSTESMVTTEIEVIVDYNLTFKDAKITNIDNENKKVTIEFTSTNDSISNSVSKVKINGKEYNITNKSGNIYTVEITLEEYKKTTLVIESVTLNNDKEFTVDKKETSFEVFKNIPSVSLDEDSNHKSLDVNYTITDNDNTLSYLRIALRDSNGNIYVYDPNSEDSLAIKVINPIENGKLTFSPLKEGSYTIEVVGTYDCADGIEHSTEVLVTKEVIIERSSYITKIQSNGYVEKNNNIDVFYTIDSNTNEDVLYLTINGKDYPTIKQSNGTYKVTYTAGSKAGTENLKVTAIKYAKENIEFNFTSQIEVLKTIPTLTDFTYNGNDAAEIKFKLNDPDKTFVKGTILITSKTSGLTKQIDINELKEEYYYDLEKLDVNNGVYTIILNITYDLDSDKEDTRNQYVLIDSEEIQVWTEYELIFETAQIESIDYDKKEVTIKFESTNASNYGVSRVIVNGTEYDVKRNGNTYTVVITLKNTNKTELKITGLILEDSKEFGEEDKVKASFVVFKTLPTAEIKAVNSGKKVTVSYNVTDSEKIAKDLKVQLRDVNGELVSDAISVTELSGTVEFTVQTAGTYIAEVIATFDAVDGRIHTNEVIGSSEITIKVEVEKITSDITSKKYVNKKEQFEIIYTIVDNTYENVTALTINGQDYQVEEVVDDLTYKVIYTAPDTSGNHEIKVTEIKYYDATVKVNHTDTVEVLKDIPTISDFTYDEEKATITFNLNNKENSILDGKIVISDSKGNIVTEIELDKTNGTKTYELNIENSGSYSLNIIATYDLDSDQSDKTNQKTEPLQETNLYIIKEYNFKFADANLKHVALDGTRVIIEFTSTNSSKYLVDKVAINGKLYTVAYEGNNKYSVEVPLEEKGTRTLEIQKVILQNGHEEKVSSEFEIYKQKPSVTVFDTTKDDKNGKIKANYVINDPNKTIISAEIIIKSSDGDFVSRVNLEDVLNGTVDFDLSHYGHGTYTIEVSATYNAVDGRGEVTEVLYTNKVTINVIASITNSYPSNYYPIKGEAITLYLDVNDNTSITNDIEYFVIGNEKYVATAVTDTIYSIKYRANEKSGIQTIKVDKVIYQSKEEVNLTGNTEITVDVLKSLPVINGYTFDDEYVKDNNFVPLLSFNLEDTDSALISGELIINGTDGSSIKKTISKGQNNIELPELLEEVNYTFYVDLVYDLDTNELNNKISGNQRGEQNNTSGTFLSGNIQIFHDYDVRVNNIELIEINKASSSVKLQFYSTNNVPLFDIQSVIVSGETYSVTKIENSNNYTVFIDLKEVKKTDLTLESIILGNGKVIDITSGERKTFTVFKNEPTAQNLELSQDNGTLSATFEITDKDNTITKLYAQLKSKSNVVVEEKELNVTDRFVEFDALKAGEYTIDILADYDLVDNLTNGVATTYKKELLVAGSNWLLLEISGEVTLESVSTYYPKKNANIELTYKINANTNENVKEFVIGDKKYTATKVCDGIYKITYKVKETAGIETITISEVVFETSSLKDSNLKGNLETKVDVLKTIPYIKDNKIYLKGNSSAGKATFEFEIVDPDKALIKDTNGNLAGSYATFGNFKDEFGNSQISLSDGDNIVTFVDVPTGVGIRFAINLAYDLDTDELNNITTDLNENRNYHPHDQIFSLVRSVTINVSNIKTFNGDKETTSFNKGEEIILTFEASTFENDGTDESYYPAFVVINGEEYPVTKKGNVYTATIPGVNVNTTLTVESVILNHGEVINIPDSTENKVIDIKVIKSSPKIQNFTHMAGNGAYGSVTVKFDIIDDDNVIIPGTIKMQLQKVGGNNVTPSSQNIKVGQSSYIHYASANVQFVLKVTASWDLGDGVTHTDELIGNAITYLPHTGAYNVKVANLELVNINEETKEATFRFKTTANDTGYSATSAIINGTTYPVKVEANNTYLVTVKLEELSKTNINLESIRIADSANFNAGLSLTLFKEKPVVSNFKINNEVENTLSATFDITDNDKTLTKLYAIVRDSDTNAIVQEKTLGNNDRSLSFNNLKQGNYKIELYGNYELVDGKTHNDELLATSEIKVKLTSQIEINSINKYPSKGETLEIIYKITSNTNEEIKSLVINGSTYDVESLGNSLYKVVYTVPSTSGKHKINVTDVNFEQQSVSSLQHSDEVDILKDKVTIENLQMTEDWSNKKVIFTFDVIDRDGAFISGYIYTSSASLGAPVTPIQKGKNTIELSAKEYEQAILFITIESDLDSDHSENNTDNRSSETMEVPYVLMDKYDVNISDVHVFNETQETIYFDKNDNITITFVQTDNTDEYDDLYPSKVLIGDKEYELSKDENKYTLVIPASDLETAGIHNVKINKVVLNNGKIIDLSKETTDKTINISVEVLKDKVTLTDFEYQVSSDNVTLTFNINDTDGALKNANISVTNNPTIEGTVVKGKNNIIIRRNGAKDYTVKITATYSRYSDGSNPVTVELLLQDLILDNYLIEMKDIQQVILYNSLGSEIKTIDNVQSFLNNYESYYVEVIMKDLPSFYSKIKTAKVENNHLYLTLDYDNTIQYQGNDSNKDIVIDFGPVTSSNNVTNTNHLETIEDLIAEINSNPSGNITLRNDIDASEYITSNDTLITVEFTGTLNGNGYTISNLPKPLFSSLNSATVTNLRLNNVTLEANKKGGALALNASNGTTITNVHVNGVKNLVNFTGVNNAGVGGMVGVLTNSTIKESSVTGLSINMASNTHTQNVGGIAGIVNNSVIQNCYTTGTINYGSYGVGGIAGSSNAGSTISNNIAYVSHNGHSTYYATRSGGIVGEPTNTTLKNNISVGSWDGYSIFGSNGTLSSESSNNYQLYVNNTNTTTTNITDPKNNNHAAVITINATEVNDELFKSKIGLSTDIWVIEKTTSINIPILRNENSTYVPDNPRISQVEGYNSNKEMLYHNLYELMPFFDAELLVDNGSKIDVNHKLNKNAIKLIMAYDSKGNVLNYLDKTNYSKIAKIKIIFDNNEILEYKVKFDALFGNIANYKITELDIDYTYNKYIINSESPIVNKIVNYLNGLSYSDLDALTNTADSVVYSDYYNKVIKKEIKEFALSYLSTSGYDATTMDENISNKIVEKIMKDDKLKKDFYTYIYISRWYDFNVGEFNVKDLVYFNGQYFNKGLTIDYLTTTYLSNEANLQTTSTDATYTRLLAPKTGISDIKSFIERLATTIGGYKDPNDWFTDEFNGYLSEIEVVGSPNLKQNANDTIEYRAWYYVKKKQDFILPIITLPDDAYAYMISGPSMYNIGSRRNYVYDPTSTEGQQKFLKYAHEFEKNFKEFYTTIAQFSRPSNFNNTELYSVDRPYVINADGTSSYVGGEKGTNDPFNLNFNIVLNIHAPQDNATMAFTMWWNDYKARIFMCYVSTLTDFRDWSHEIGHAETGSVFDDGAGRRQGSGVEDVTDGNVTQEPGDGVNNWNLTYNYDKDAKVTANLTTERINTLAKLQDFYKKMYETADYLDYIEAIAFLELTPAEQSKIAVQVTYTNETAEERAADVGGPTTTYRLLTESEIAAMNLRTVEDLWDNRIIIRPGTTGDTTIGKSVYWAPNFFQRRWYQPHNNNIGAADAYTLKTTAWEMMGLGGYESYKDWYGSRLGDKSTDLYILRRAVCDNPDTCSVTWKSYKMARYAEMESYWKSGTGYIDADTVKEEFVVALKADAANANNRNVTRSTDLKKSYYYYIKQITDDFRGDVFTDYQRQEKTINSAEELISAIEKDIFAELNIGSDIDFSNYNSDKAIILKTFKGVLNGNGHKFYNISRPVFDTLEEATINNLIIEDVNIKLSEFVASKNQDYVGSLARKVTGGKIENVKLNNISIIKDNGTTIGSNIGGLVGSATRTKIKNVYITNVNISAYSNAGGLVGYLCENSSITESSATNPSNSEYRIYIGGNAGASNVGGIAGYVNNSSVTNSYVNLNVVGGGYFGIGGLVGRILNGTIENNYVAGSVTSEDSMGDLGGLIGDVDSVASIKNNVVFASTYSWYGERFALGLNDNMSNVVSNNYVLKSAKCSACSISVSSSLVSFIPDETVIKTEEFYTVTLGWSKEIWNFSNVSNGGLPTLKNGDPNSRISLMIESLSDLIVDFEEKNNDDTTIEDEDSKIETDIEKDEDLKSPESNMPEEELPEIKEDEEKESEEDNTNESSAEKDLSNLYDDSNLSSNEITDTE